MSDTNCSTGQIRTEHKDTPLPGNMPAAGFRSFGCRARGGCGTVAFPIVM